MPDHPLNPDNPADVSAAMADIQKLDPGASVRFNGTMWYVAASVDVIEDGMAGRSSAFSDTPALAVCSYHQNLAEVRLPEYIATRTPRRRHWLWNGEAFMELPSLPADDGMTVPG